MHRLIMLSSVYQESSANNPRFAQVDPDNRLLWRANIRRLEFEALRDSLLAIGGDLDLDDVRQTGRYRQANHTQRAARSTASSTARMSPMSWSILISPIRICPPGAAMKPPCRSRRFS